MKVLPKKELITQQQKEQEQVARRASALSEAISKLHEQKESEEAKLTRWRETTFRTIQGEIEEKQTEKSSLEKDILVLQEKRQKLLIPLDTEWDKIRDKKIALSQQREELDKEKGSLQSRIQAVGQREIEAQRQRENIERMEQESARKLEHAEIIAVQAKEEVAVMRNQAHATLLEAELRDQESSKLKLIYEKGLNDVEERELAVNLKIKELEAFDKALQDKYKTLLRTQERLKHG